MPSLIAEELRLRKVQREFEDKKKEAVAA
jgi:hypothetical protein